MHIVEYDKCYQTIKTTLKYEPSLENCNLHFSGHLNFTYAKRGGKCKIKPV